MKELPFCSIIVLNFNGKRYLYDCFESISRIKYPKDKYEVIMVDNGSTDDSVNFVKKNFPRVSVLRLDRNWGFAEGNNKGVEKTKGEYIIFLNNDTAVHKEWLMKLVKTASKSKDIGICGSKVIDKKLEAEIGEGRLNFLGIPDIRSRHDSEKECFFVSGVSMLIKKSVLSKFQHCFDPEYFAYFEDIDLCWRTRILGYKVIYVPKSIVSHEGGGTSSKGGRVKGTVRRSSMKFYHYRNKIWTFKKNLRFPLEQIFLVPISLITILMAFYWTNRNEWDRGLTVLKYIFSDVKKTPHLDEVSLKDQLKMFFI